MKLCNNCFARNQPFVTQPAACVLLSLQIGPADAAAGAAAASSGPAIAPGTYVTFEFKEPLVVDSDLINHTAQEDASPADADAVTAASEPTVDLSDNSSTTSAVGNGDASNFQFIQLFPGDSSSASQPTPLSDITNTGSSARPTATTEIAGSGSRRLQQSTALAVQDVLVVYTTLAASKAGGVDALRSRVQENFARANLAYRDSKVKVQLTLLAFQPVRYCKGTSTGSCFIVDVSGDTAAAAAAVTVHFALEQR
jgi:hypothetical protein